MPVEEEWKKIIDENQSIYIYGAGNIGKKILRLIEKTENAALKVQGFLVSDMTGNPERIDKYYVTVPQNLSDRDSLILVAVTDVYQDNIIDSLKILGFSNVVTAYKYSFIGGEDEWDSQPKIIKVDTHELLLCQYRAGLFNRYDIIVRLLAIENYYGKNQCGFALYQKMQNMRTNDKEYGKISMQRFIRLIQSYEKYGYDENSELVVDEDLHLIDGSHRLALAIHFGTMRLRVRAVKREDKIWYGEEWFTRRFSMDEYKMMRERLFMVEKRWGDSIKGILWPSVSEYFNEIVELIRTQYSVTNIKDIVLNLEKFEKKVYQVYEVDSIAQWKINTKLKYMRQFSPYYIRTFDIDMGNPEFRIKKAGDGILSDKGARLKEEIRNRYKGRVQGYFSDIIFHTADNFYQSRYIDKIFMEEKQNEPNVLGVADEN